MAIDERQSPGAQTSAEDDILRSFRNRAKSALEPGFLELLSDETRKSQRLLLAWSFVLLMLGNSAVAVGTTARVLGLEFTIDQPTLIQSLVSVCLYFEVLVAIRCLNDWRAYRLRTSVSDIDLAALANEVEATSRDLADSIGDLKRGDGESFEENRLRAIMGFGREREGVGTILETDPRFQEARKAVELYYRKRSEASNFVDRADWLRSQLRALRASRTLRVSWEVAFPLTFGGLGLWTGVAAWLR